MTKDEFIEEIAKYVLKYAPQFNIKVASPIIAQACLESGYGSSYKASFHNYFGLKNRGSRVTCSSGIFTDTSKEQNADGTYRDIVTEWYMFPTLEMGVLGYFQFTNITLYSSIKNITDPYQYLMNLKASGYATSLSYVKNVLNVIGKNDLTRFDEFEIKPMKYKVAIDAGHGSNTAGKRTPDGYREHWINVACASFCEQALQRSGIDTVRVAWDDTNAKDDEDVSLSQRQKIVKANKCDISVSFHANAYGNGWNDAQGVETLISLTSYGDSLNLANKVQSYLIQGTKQKNRGVKKQRLAMCNCGAMGTKASILVEIGFMTNKAEADLMKTDAFCREQAEETAHGICDYLGVEYIKPTDSIVYTIVQDSQTTPQSSFLVKITTDVLNVRGGASTSYPVVTTVHKGEVYTIVDTQGNWGKLKSGAGWISLKYTMRI